MKRVNVFSPTCVKLVIKYDEDFNLMIIRQGICNFVLVILSLSS